MKIGDVLRADQTIYTHTKRCTTMKNSNCYCNYGEARRIAKGELFVVLSEPIHDLPRLGGQAFSIFCMGAGGWREYVYVPSEEIEIPRFVRVA